MKKLHTITIVFLILSSCYTELETKTEQAQVAVSAFIANDNMVKVNLLKTTPAGAIAQKTFINDANIDLYEDEKYIETLTLQDSTYQLNGHTYTIYYYSSGTKVQVGKTYSTVVSAPDGTILKGETTIPQPVAIAYVDTIFDYSINAEDNTLLKKETYKIRLKDPIGENYYRITMRKRYGRKTGTNTVTIYERNGEISFWETDSIFSYFNEDEQNEIFTAARNNFLIFSDEKIEGHDYEVVLNREFSETHYNTSNGGFVQYIIELHSLSEEAFLYLRTFDLQSQLDGLEEPILSYTNIENGVGIFAGYSISQKIITMGEYPIDGIKYDLE